MHNHGLYSTSCCKKASAQGKGEFRTDLDETWNLNYLPESRQQAKSHFDKVTKSELIKQAENKHIVVIVEITLQTAVSRLSF